MTSLIRTTALLSIVGGLAGLSAPGLAAQERRPMDERVYEIWQRIQDSRISNDGGWLSYTVSPMDGDGLLHIRAVSSQAAYAFPRGKDAAFSDDSRYLVFLIAPQDSIVKQARIDDIPRDEMPTDSLAILDLSDGSVIRIERVKSFTMPDEGSGWLAYLLEEETEGHASESQEPEQESGAAAAGETGEDEEQPEAKDEGTTLVLRALDSGAETRFELVDSYLFSEGGERLAFTVSSEFGDADGVFVVTPGSGAVAVLTGAGHYPELALSLDGSQVAFLTDRDEYDQDQPQYALYHWAEGTTAARALARQDTEGLPAGWWVSEHGNLSFSDLGARLYFATAPRPEPDPAEETPEWERINVDIWHWQDPLLQSQQLVEREAELKRTYRAVVHLVGGRVVQLADTIIPEVEVGRGGDAPVGIARTNMPYRQETSWDSPDYSDVYLVDVDSGERRRVLEAVRSTVRMSPAGNYLAWWDGDTLAWFALPVGGGGRVNLTDAMPFNLFDELHDSPSLPPAYGFAGWTPGDEDFLVYDRFDIWAVDPAGARAPRSVTEGMGRENGVRLRYVSLDPEADSIPPNEDMLLSAFDQTTRASGFFRDRVRGTRPPAELIMEGAQFGTPTRAEDGDVLMFTRESFVEFPNVWTADLRLRNLRQHSDANPQQSEYLWGSAEVVSWRATDGRPHEGLLFKPDGFDPSGQYPMMVYFYDKNSENLHQHRAPFAHRSVINPTYYASRGYVVFIPDIHYRIGYPGESAMNSVVSGTLNIIERGFVDPERIGVQGHSWGGYQIAYMVTRTNIFAAAEAGAPVANMTSAYGGIRWDTGLSRMFQYEHAQSRLGGTLWDSRSRYIENSPLFWADRVETPLLIMHNDHDGHVPWYQGIEYFVALRRLGKPAWLVNYSGERHWPTTEWKRRDWQRRMQGFFDHYLMGAPAPRWLAEGIPAVNRGRDLGF